MAAADGFEAEPIFIAVDFGTTNSAFAFVIGGKSTDYIVQAESGGIDQGKTPTVVLLNPDSSLHSFGRQAWEVFLGLDEDEAEQFFLFDRFKMRLKDDSKVSGNMLIPASNNEEKSLPARIVFGRALEYFYRAARKHVSNSLCMSEDSLMKREVKWILTVPAKWGDRAKAFMKEAAIEAGMIEEVNSENIIIELEPEGAALCCRDDLTHVWRDLGKPDQMRYVVVDCGGGTVDITVHDLPMNVPSNMRRISEVHRASGDAWGGIYVDEKVKMLVKRAIGEEIAKKIPPEDWLRFMHVSVEDAKRKVAEGVTQVAISIPTELLQAVAVHGGDLQSSAKQCPGVFYRKRQAMLNVEIAVFEKCFEESLQSITHHLHSLKRRVRGIQCILVVGGYAESLILFRRMQEEFHNPSCRVIRPNHASLAIVKGALMFGQDTQVIVKRISKFTYGIETCRVFNPTKHPEHKKLTVDGQDFCMDIFDEIVRIDQPVAIGDVIRKSYKPTYADQTSLSFKIFRTDDSNHPLEYTDGCELLGCTTIAMPNTEKGLDRHVLVKIEFRQTMMHFTAVDEDTGHLVNVDFMFHHRDVS